MTQASADIISKELERMAQLAPGFAHQIEKMASRPEASAPKPVASNEVRKHLMEAANIHGDLVVMMGWGDGELVRYAAKDAICRTKDWYICVLHDELAGFKSLIYDGLTEDLINLHAHLSVLQNPDDVHAWANHHFTQHDRIPRLGGLTLIDTHPIPPAASDQRDRLLPVLVTALKDRPQLYGNDIDDSLTGLLNAAKNADLLLQAPQLEQLHGHFGKTPIISIGAGPSVADHLPRLRELQNKCILVACDAVFHGLLDAGIEPHFVTPLERVTGVIPLVDRATGTRSIYAGIPVVPPPAVSAFSQGHIGVSCGDQLYDWLWPSPHFRINSGLSTGTLSVNVAMALGQGDVYLVGHDLAREPDKTHWDGAHAIGESLMNSLKANKDAIHALNDKDERRIAGNNGELVDSTTWWERFRNDIEISAFNMQQTGRKLYNTNAFHKKYARINYTHSADLPTPDDLATLSYQHPSNITNRDAYNDWRRRCRALPEDTEKLINHLQSLHARIDTQRNQSPLHWKVDEIAKEIDVRAPVSEGNKAAFNYVLRSAMHNTAALMHSQKRCANWAQSQHKVFDSMTCLIESLTNALRGILPQFREISDD